MDSTRTKLRDSMDSMLFHVFTRWIGALPPSGALWRWKAIQAPKRCTDRRRPQNTAVASASLGIAGQADSSKDSAKLILLQAGIQGIPAKLIWKDSSKLVPNFARCRNAADSDGSSFSWLFIQQRAGISEWPWDNPFEWLSQVLQSTLRRDFEVLLTGQWTLQDPDNGLYIGTLARPWWEWDDRFASSLLPVGWVVSGETTDSQSPQLRTPHEIERSFPWHTAQVSSKGPGVTVEAGRKGGRRGFS